MMISIYINDLADLCRRLGVLALLLMGGPASASTTPTPVPTYSEVAVSWRPEIHDMFAASAATSDHVAVSAASLVRARHELAAARTILERFDARDSEMDDYVHEVRQIVGWLERPGADLRTDAPTLAARLESARLRFSERTTSLSHWLALQRAETPLMVIPSRFVVAASAEPAEVPDYRGRLVARELLA